MRELQIIYLSRFWNFPTHRISHVFLSSSFLSCRRRSCFWSLISRDRRKRLSGRPAPSSERERPRATGHGHVRAAATIRVRGLPLPTAHPRCPARSASCELSRARGSTSRRRYSATVLRLRAPRRWTVGLSGRPRNTNFCVNVQSSADVPILNAL